MAEISSSGSSCVQSSTSLLERVLGKCSQSNVQGPSRPPPPAPFTHYDDAPEHLLEYQHSPSWLSRLTWWYSPASSAEARKAERNLLSRVPFYQADVESTNETRGTGIIARSGYVNIAEKDEPPVLIHTLTVNDQDKVDLSKPQDVGVVLGHGYGGGIGIWYSSLSGIMQGLKPQGQNLPVYAIDWLGMAQSARVPFPFFNIPNPTSKKSEQDEQALNKAYDQRALVAEEYFVDSLENWRRAVGLSRMILVGHSLGGYLSAAYAIKYPKRVERLILVSPAGVPSPPAEPASAPSATKLEEASARMSGPDDERPPEAIALDASVAANSSSGENVAPSEEPVSGEFEGPNDAEQPHKKPPTLLMKTFRYLWEQGYTPFSLARAIGPFGPHLFNMYSTRRFAHLPSEEINSLKDYMYHVNVAGRPSGEYALVGLLRPGAFAYRPLVEQLRPWVQKRFEESSKQIGQHPDIVFLYGDHDWMNHRHSLAVRKYAPNPDQVVVRCVPNASHQVFLDNPEGFVNLLIPAILGQEIPEVVPINMEEGN